LLFLQAKEQHTLAIYFSQMPLPERRRHTRYACDLTVEVQPANEPEIYSGQLADICLGGCYISTVTPLPAGVSVLVHFKASEQQAALLGKTVTSLPGIGMGIEFTAPAASEGSELLRALIEFLDHAAAKDALKQAAFSG
jgi:hypothetical protein